MGKLPVIETERLRLRPLRVEDAEAMHAVFSDAELMTYWSRGPMHEIGETRDYVRENAEGEDYPSWAITLLDDAKGTALGWIVLIPKSSRIAEIGYNLRRDRWGQGIASEALRAAIGHAFGLGGYARVMADVDPDNAPSNRLLERLGFTLEGRLRGQWETHIGVRDSLIWGLLREEWCG